MKTRVIFRADGNISIGLGHVFRSLALVEMLRNEFECLFIIYNPEAKLEKLIKSFCNIHTLHVVDKKIELKELENVLSQDDIMVTDGYEFNEEYQKHIKSKVKKLAMIDDKAEMYFFADLVINHGGQLLKKNYFAEPHTIVVTGFEYLVIRHQFLNFAATKRIISKVDTVFICMGGSDPFNITAKVFKAAINCDFIKRVIIVIGSANNNHAELTELAEKISAKTITIEKNIDANRMVELMAQCEIAICTASSVALEVCCVKAGLLTGTVVDNQLGIHRQLHKSACCLSLHDLNVVSIEEITQSLYKLKTVTAVQTIVDNQSRVIDGLSGERILNLFKQLAA